MNKNSINMTNTITKTEQATITLARQFAKTLRGGDIVLLEGELGAGKTVFVKGLAKALGIKQTIKSPTFVLMRVYKNIKVQEYKNIKNFVHCDAYRVENPQDIMEAGLADWIRQKDALIVIEWGEKILPILKKFNPVRIKFQHGKKRDERIIRFAP